MDRLVLLEFSVVELNQDHYSFYTTIQSKAKEYDQRIEVVDKSVVKWSCSCTFGSTFRFSKENIASDKKCKHITFIYDLLRYLNYLK